MGPIRLDAGTRPPFQTRRRSASARDRGEWVLRAERVTDQELTLTPLLSARYAAVVVITLNGERFELEQPLSVTDLLARIELDPRRVAIEHNLSIIRRQTFPEVLINEGDRVEIVNFVGGG